MSVSKPFQENSLNLRTYPFSAVCQRWRISWLEASSSDQGQLAIYAAERASDGALTLVIINKTANAFTSTVSLAGFDPAATPTATTTPAPPAAWIYIPLALR